MDKTYTRTMLDESAPEHKEIKLQLPCPDTGSNCGQWSSIEQLLSYFNPINQSFLAGMREVNKDEALVKFLSQAYIDEKGIDNAPEQVSGMGHVLDTKQELCERLSKSILERYDKYSKALQDAIDGSRLMVNKAANFAKCMEIACYVYEDDGSGYRKCKTGTRPDGSCQDATSDSLLANCSELSPSFLNELSARVVALRGAANPPYLYKCDSAFPVNGGTASKYDFTWDMKPETDSLTDSNVALSVGDFIIRNVFVGRDYSFKLLFNRTLQLGPTLQNTGRGLLKQYWEDRQLSSYRRLKSNLEDLKSRLCKDGSCDKYKPKVQNSCGEDVQELTPDEKKEVASATTVGVPAEPERTTSSPASSQTAAPPSSPSVTRNTPAVTTPAVSTSVHAISKAAVTQTPPPVYIPDRPVASSIPYSPTPTPQIPKVSEDVTLIDTHQSPLDPSYFRLGNNILEIPPDQITVIKSNEHDSISTLRAGGDVLLKSGFTSFGISVKVFFFGKEQIRKHLVPIIGMYKIAPINLVDNFYISSQIYGIGSLAMRGARQWLAGSDSKQQSENGALLGTLVPVVLDSFSLKVIPEYSGINIEAQFNMRYFDHSSISPYMILDQEELQARLDKWMTKLNREKGIIDADLGNIQIDTKDNDNEFVVYGYVYNWLLANGVTVQDIKDLNKQDNRDECEGIETPKTADPKPKPNLTSTAQMCQSPTSDGSAKENCSSSRKNIGGLVFPMDRDASRKPHGAFTLGAGDRGGGFGPHFGTDYAPKDGSIEGVKIIAPCDGSISVRFESYKGRTRPSGGYIATVCGSDYSYSMMHLDPTDGSGNIISGSSDAEKLAKWRAVWAGGRVKQGQVLGLMGKTGRATGKHLHLAVKDKRNKIINPETVFTSTVAGTVSTDKIVTLDQRIAEAREAVDKADLFEKANAIKKLAALEMEKAREVKSNDINNPTEAAKAKAIIVSQAEAAISEDVSQDKASLKDSTLISVLEQINQGWKVDPIKTNSKFIILVKNYAIPFLEQRPEVRNARIGSADILINSIAFGYSNKIATIPIVGHVCPFYQYMGASNVEVSLEGAALNDGAMGANPSLLDLQTLFNVKENQLVDIRNKTRNIPSMFNDIQTVNIYNRVLYELGMKSFILNDLVVGTVPGSPDVSSVQLTMTENYFYDWELADLSTPQAIQNDYVLVDKVEQALRRYNICCPDGGNCNNKITVEDVNDGSNRPSKLITAIEYFRNSSKYTLCPGQKVSYVIIDHLSSMFQGCHKVIRTMQTASARADAAAVRDWVVDGDCYLKTVAKLSIEQRREVEASPVITAMDLSELSMVRVFEQLDTSTPNRYKVWCGTPDNARGSEVTDPALKQVAVAQARAFMYRFRRGVSGRDNDSSHYSNWAAETNYAFKTPEEITGLTDSWGSIFSLITLPGSLLRAEIANCTKISDQRAFNEEYKNFLLSLYGTHISEAIFDKTKDNWTMACNELQEDPDYKMKKFLNVDYNKYFSTCYPDLMINYGIKPGKYLLTGLNDKMINTTKMDTSQSRYIGVGNDLIDRFRLPTEGAPDSIAVSRSTGWRKVTASAEIATPDSPIEGGGTVTERTYTQQTTIPSTVPIEEYFTKSSDQSGSDTQVFLDAVKRYTSMDQNGFRSLKDKEFTFDACYPGFKIYLMEDGAAETELSSVFGMAVNAWDSFYSYNAIVEMEIARFKSDVDVAVIKFLNTFGTLTTRVMSNSVYIEPTKYKDVSTDETFVDHDNVITRLENDTLVKKDKKTGDYSSLSSMMLQAGTKVCIKLGYSNDINNMPTVFTGLVNQINNGEVVTVVCQGFLSEMLTEVNRNEYGGYWEVIKSKLGIEDPTMSDATTDPEKLPVLGTLNEYWNVFGGVHKQKCFTEKNNSSYTWNIINYLLQHTACLHFGKWTKNSVWSPQYSKAGYPLVTGSYYKFITSQGSRAMANVDSNLRNHWATKIALQKLCDPESAQFSKFYIGDEINNPTIWSTISMAILRHPEHVMMVRPFGADATLIVQTPMSLYNDLPFNPLGVSKDCEEGKRNRLALYTRFMESKIDGDKTNYDKWKDKLSTAAVTEVMPERIQVRLALEKVIQAPSDISKLLDKTCSKSDIFLKGIGIDAPIDVARGVQIVEERNIDKGKLLVYVNARPESEFSIITPKIDCLLSAAASTSAEIKRYVIVCLSTFMDSIISRLGTDGSSFNGLVNEVGRLETIMTNTMYATRRKYDDLIICYPEDMLSTAGNARLYNGLGLSSTIHPYNIFLTSYPQEKVYRLILDVVTFYKWGIPRLKIVHGVYHETIAWDAFDPGTRTKCLKFKTQCLKEFFSENLTSCADKPTVKSMLESIGLGEDDDEGCVSIDKLIGRGSGNYGDSYISTLGDPSILLYCFKDQGGAELYSDWKTFYEDQINTDPELMAKMPSQAFMRPVTNFHLACSKMNIIFNNIKTNGDIFNTVEITGTQGGEGVCKVQFDDDLVPHYIRSRKIPVLDIEGNSGGFIRKLLSPWIGGKPTDAYVQGLAHVYGMSLLKHEMQKMYTGELGLVGNPYIQPFDVVCINDGYNDVHGSFEVDSVIHRFTANEGFITFVKPHLIIAISDIALAAATGHMEDILNLGSLNSKLFDSEDDNPYDTPIYAGVLKDATKMAAAGVGAAQWAIAGASMGASALKWPGMLIGGVVGGAIGGGVAGAGYGVAGGYLGSKILGGGLGAWWGYSTYMDALNTNGMSLVQSAYSFTRPGEDSITSVIGQSLFGSYSNFCLNNSVYREPLIIKPLNFGSMPFVAGIRGARHNSWFDHEVTKIASFLHKIEYESNAFNRGLRMSAKQFNIFRDEWFLTREPITGIVNSIAGSIGGE